MLTRTVNLAKRDEMVLEQIRSRVSQTLKLGLQFETSTELSEKFLRRHVNGRVKLAILYADIEGSTRMSMTIPAQALASIVQVFSQEMTMLTTDHGGYVLKYVGDAVISFFPGEFDNRKACSNAVQCARSMLKVVAEGLNPAFTESGLPKIGIKVGIDFGESLVVLYGKDPAKSYIDMVGSTISIAAKITSIANPGQIVIGQNVFNVCESGFKKEFVELEPDPRVWGFKDLQTGKPYKLYSTL